MSTSRRPLRPFRSAVCCLAAILLAISTLAATVTAASSAPQNSAAAEPDTGPVVETDLQHDLSAPLDELAEQEQNAPPAADEAHVPPVIKGEVFPTKVLKKAQTAPLTTRGSAAVQRADAPGGTFPEFGVNFEGINNRNGVFPPDTDGDVGLNHFVQIVNLSFAVYNKQTGQAVLGPVNNNTLWQGFGGECERTNHGDPIVQFDHLANRWMISQFAIIPAGATSNHQCIAVSQTSDPTGAWYRYDFPFPKSGSFNDYPKFGVWPDGYYMSVNQFGNAAPNPFTGAGALAYEREQMLQGLPARQVYFDVGQVSTTFGGQLPSDVQGDILPPEGAPNLFVEVDDNTFGFPTDRLNAWEFRVDWDNPANSTFGNNLQPSFFLDTAPFDSNMCGFARSCIPQPSTSSRLDAISDRLMYRLDYRNFGDHQSLVLNHTVDVNGADHAGIRWYELRSTDGGDTWGMHQQGTYAPDASHRWMGSIGMDAVGNIAMGYSVSSSTVFPSIRTTGRLANDPLGEMTQGEGVLIAGGGSQLDTRARWGDYSSLTVDPTDDCTFWYTNEYYGVSSNANWQTRVGSFRYPNCAAGPAGTISGTVTDADTSAPIQGVTVAAGQISTTTDAQGHYALTVPVGSYDMSASKFPYLTQTVEGVTVEEDATVTQDFALQPAPTHTVSGTVSDGDGNPVAGARVSIGGTPIPSVTTGADGTYQITDVPEGTYQATAEDGRCLDPQTQQLVVSGDTTLDFTLPRRSDAYGYFCSEEAADYIEADSVLPLSGDDQSTSVQLPFRFFMYGKSYNTAFVSTNGNVNFLAPNTTFTNASLPTAAAPNAAIYPFWDDLNVDAQASVRTEVVGQAPNRQFVIEWRNIIPLGQSALRFDAEVVLHENGQILLQYRNIDDNVRERGSSATVGIENESGTVARQYSFNEAVLPLGTSALRFRIPPSAFVQGTVTDANDDGPIAGATVTATADGEVAGETTTDADGTYAMQLRLGTYVVEASAANYESSSEEANLDTDGAFVTVDFPLDTAAVRAAPESFNLVVPAGETRQRTLTLTNEGSADATFELAARGGGGSAATPAKAPANPDVLYDNGPFVTHPGAGPGGSDLSVLQTALGLNIFGLNAAQSVGFRMADDFTVDDGWAVDSIRFYGYQTGSSTNSTFTGVNYRIWDGPPNNPSSNVVFGDTTTNRLLDTSWSNTYRVTDTSTDTQRPIMTIDASAGFELEPGNYWLDWQFNGSLASGPWQPPISILGQTTTGNALQFDVNTNTWINALDDGTNTQQGLPFTIDGSFTAGPEWLQVNPTSGTIAPGGSTDVSVSIDTTGLEPGIYNARVVVDSNSGRRPRFDVPVQLVVPAYQQGVNAGGESYVDGAEDTWGPDQAYEAGGWGYTRRGQVLTTGAQIAGTDDQPLYQRARRDPGSYRFDNLPDGTYVVDLRFAEIQPYVPGLRVFDVRINGDAVLTGYDIAREVGLNHADDHSFTVDVTGGTLQIAFEARRGQQPPIINALRVTERPDL